MCLCRYNVLYGSAGFNWYGYQGGCQFATGNFQQAIAVPAAAQYLCNPSAADQEVCHHDHSGSGVCQEVSDGFFATVCQPPVDFV